MANVKDVHNTDPTSIELGGKVRTIQFDLNSFAELENKFGTIQAAMEQLQAGKMADLRTILWAGLIHEETVFDQITGEPKGYNITPYQVGAWIKNPAMLQEVSQKLGIAMGNDSPAPENMVNAVVATQQEASAGMATVVLTDEEKAEQAKNG